MKQAGEGRSASQEVKRGHRRARGRQEEARKVKGEGDRGQEGATRHQRQEEAKEDKAEEDVRNNREETLPPRGSRGE